MVILITGAAGSIGRALTERLRACGHRVIPTDIAMPANRLDVTDAEDVERWLRAIRPDVICHLAGAKHAPAGELDPEHVARVNLDGTRNVVHHAWPAKVVLSSTCKAADPETAYGASKLLAERIVLNAGGTVVRLYNVRESSGNVFRLWESLPEEAPIPWTDCWRYFVSMETVLELCQRALSLPPGRYAPDPGPPQHMRDVAMAMYPGRTLIEIPRRRGDRKREPLCAASERRELIEPGLVRITSAHDADARALIEQAVAA